MKDLLSLAEAADELGIKPVTLRAAVARERFAARKFGNTWVTTRAEVERYRRDSLGQGGRPASILQAKRPTIFDRSEPRVGSEPGLTKGRVEPPRRR